ncbi:MAG: hypothetical protein BGO21_28250 [Dyadobacter sp. 50-39]|uniref:type II toxin-antitoxin system VapC family toxin n=1 Tax=Dyadobacter sp. 50-39 TaxID=1895756 RepID=UPI000961CF21|nr:type II toxin-antitoxin system VapC family toxin [Dyadobacter sp. 50-39]OJV16757.1 MAG: hypothetical protein BGO21_28250 [Dyadobacter sp. 50-39]
MNLLLDTHTVVWYIAGDNRLPLFLRKKIEDSSNNCFVSMASLWELAIKSAIGKLELQADLGVIVKIIKRSGIAVLPVKISHVLSVGRLPLHHNDPFDRMIISQCLAEKLTMVSCDKQFRHYDLPVIWNRSDNC